MSDETKENKALDEDTVDKIVEKMKRREKGLTTSTDESVSLRGEVTGKKEVQLALGTVEELADFSSPLIRTMVKIYLSLQDPLKPLQKFIQNLSAVQSLQYYLHSANMKYSLNQYLSLVTAGTFLSAVVGLLIGISIAYVFKLNLLLWPVLGILSAFFVGLLVLFLLIMIPKSIAFDRGREISIEMPFALRHMATELKSGAGLYRTIQLVATADYGILSEEFARTINEIEEGVDAKDALKSMAYRVQSVSMRNALNHVVRAMKTGGNLAEVMNDIAADVSVELRNNISEFSEKMNFFGVIFIFVGITMPIMIAVLGGLANAPLPTPIQLPITPVFLVLFYFIIMPIIFAFMIMYLKQIQPKA